MPDLGILQSKKAAFGKVNDSKSIELTKLDALSAPARQFLKGPPPHIFSTGPEDFILEGVIIRAASLIKSTFPTYTVPPETNWIIAQHSKHWNPP